MNIGILFGGNSLEHEISIVTAYQLKKRIEKYHRIEMIYVDYDNTTYLCNNMSINNFKNNKFNKLRKVSFTNKRIKNIDCMILACHGENCEDGIFAALCRLYHIPYVGSDILASSISLDKYRCYKMLSSNGILMLDTILYTYDDYLVSKENNIYPCIIKPLYGGSSIGIFICNNKEEFDEKIIEAFKYSKKLIIQSYYSKIEEYNLAIYENGVSRLEKIEIKDNYFTFDDKYQNDFKLIHKPMSDDSLSQRFKEIGRNVYKLIDASGIIRIDFFMIDNDIYVNEVNIIPGALAMYLFDDFDRVIGECINLAIMKENKIYNRGSFLSKSNINK